MYAILLSLFTGALVGCALGYSNAAAPGWAVAWGVVTAFFTMIAVTFVVRRKVAGETAALQVVMTEGQRLLQARINDWEHHPKGDPRRFMESIRTRQGDLVRTALENTESLRKFSRWVPMFERQLASIKVQLYWQLKDFEKVDELLPKCLIIDPLTASLKLARQFMKGDELAAIEKSWRKIRGSFRYNQSALVCATMSWIYVKKGKIDEAYKLLEKACRDNNTDSEPGMTLLRNRDALANNRLKHFTNANIGDQWYGLMLEEPRVRYERRAPSRFGKFG